MIDIQRQEEIRKFIDEEVHACQSSLVDGLLNKGIFNYEDIENYYEAAEEKEPREIYEWWVVSYWLTIKLRQHGEPILNNEYGTWWGRTCSGQAIYMDSVINAVYDEIMHF